MQWEEGGHTWRQAKGSGYGQIEEEELREDPLMRLAMRWSPLEFGTQTVRAATGVEVGLDSAERSVLGRDGNSAAAQRRAQQADEASAAANKVALGLHIESGFTDAWATDGSRGTVWEAGTRHTRVACGAYRGAMPVYEMIVLYETTISYG